MILINQLNSKIPVAQRLMNIEKKFYSRYLIGRVLYQFIQNRYCLFIQADLNVILGQFLIYQFPLGNGNIAFKNLLVNSDCLVGIAADTVNLGKSQVRIKIV